MPTADMDRHPSLARLALFVLGLAMCAFASTAQAQNSCTHVERVPIVTTFVPCTTSPFDVCTVGTIGSGPLAGTTSFVVLSEFVHGNVVFFSGVFTVTTAEGTATFFTRGVLNGVTDKFQEIFKATAGTGAFEGLSGTLTSRGVETETGFSGTLMGVICTPEPPSD